MAFDNDDQGDKPVEEGETYEVEIEDLGSKGDGIARVDNFVVFVPDTEVGERVMAEIDSVGRKFAFGEVTERLGEAEDAADDVAEDAVDEEETDDAAETDESEEDVETEEPAEDETGEPDELDAEPEGGDLADEAPDTEPDEAAQDVLEADEPDELEEPDGPVDEAGSLDEEPEEPVGEADDEPFDDDEDELEDAPGSIEDQF